MLLYAKQDYLRDKNVFTTYESLEQFVWKIDLEGFKMVGYEW